LAGAAHTADVLPRAISSAIVRRTVDVHARQPCHQRTLLQAISVSAAVAASHDVVGGPNGELVTGAYDVVADSGQLLATAGGVPLARLAFYRPDYVLVLGPNGGNSFSRANFVRGAGGRVDWIRLGGRLSRHVPAGAASGATVAPRFDFLRPWSVLPR
jgi:hypothetical protein